MLPKLNITVVDSNGTYTVLDGMASEHHLTPTAAHIYEQDNQQIVVWTVGCDLNAEEIRTVVQPRLEGWRRPHV